MDGVLHCSVAIMRQLELRGLGIILVLGCICGLAVAVNFDNGRVLRIFTLTSFRGLNTIESGCSCIGDAVELMVGVATDFGDKRSASHVFLEFLTTRPSTCFMVVCTHNYRSQRPYCPQLSNLINMFARTLVICRQST